MSVVPRLKTSCCGSLVPYREARSETDIDCPRCRRVHSREVRRPMTENVDRVIVGIETIDLERDSIIVSIGAVRFDADGLGDAYRASILPVSCLEARPSIDTDTLGWWLEQDGAGREQLTGDDLDKVFTAFVVWIRNSDEIWANISSFDCELIEYACDASTLTPPGRDYRTLVALPVAPDWNQEGVEHNALDDAEHLARMSAEPCGGSTSALATLRTVMDDELAT